MTEITIATTAQDAASRSLQVTVGVAHLADAERRAVKEYARRARMPGFRKGHAPEPMIRRRFGAEIRQFVLEDALREAWQQILADDQLKPTSDPQVRNVSFEEGQPLTFEMLVEVRPQITVHTTGGFALERTVEPVSDAQLDEQLTKLREQRGTWAPIAEGVRPREGQLVTVTVENLVDGAPAAAATPHSLVLGQGQAIPDLEERITTMLPGETVEADVRLPDDHPDESRRGEPRRVRITLHEIKEQQLPALDDALAREVGDFASLEALRTAIREDLEADAARTADARVRDQLIQRLAEANEVPAPASLVNRLLGVYAESYGIGQDQAEMFASSFRPVAEAQVKRELILDAVATAQNLRATEAELDARISQMAAARGVEPAKVYAQLEQSKRLHDLEHQLTEEKAFAWLLEQSTISEGAA
jgi:trigger factor